MSVDNDEKTQEIEDKYTSQIAPSADSTDKDEDKRDAATVRRENFLNIYNENADNGEQSKEDGPDLSNGIKFKHDAEEDSGFELKTGADS